MLILCLHSTPTSQNLCFDFFSFYRFVCQLIIFLKLIFISFPVHFLANSFPGVGFLDMFRFYHGASSKFESWGPGSMFIINAFDPLTLLYITCNFVLKQLLSARTKPCLSLRLHLERQGSLW